VLFSQNVSWKTTCCGDERIARQDTPLEQQYSK
jgi:hypothetical protein